MDTETANGKFEYKPRYVVYGGAFDIIHPGHISAIREAKSYGDHLIILLTPDERIRAKKGRDPVFNQEERMKILAGIEGVDEVAIFPSNDDGGVEEALREIKPEVYIRDRDANPKWWAQENRLCKELGIRLIVMGRHGHWSSSDIIKKIKNENS